MKADIKSLTPAEVSAALSEMGEPAFRGKQVYEWLMRGAEAFSQMENLPKALREKLDERFMITRPEILRKQLSKIDGTVKYLWKLRDGNSVESVVMRYKHGNSICISSQVGCRMGCAFCASAKGGLVRSLAPSEILDQILFARIDLGEPIQNVVMMGIGEPLDNFDNVITFLKLLNHPAGLGIGMRHVSLSTCGLIKKIDKLGDYNLQLTLSVSLHAVEDEVRNRIMPVNKAVGTQALFDTCRRYFQKTGRRISFEYAMIRGVNDSEAQARLLADKLKGSGSHVNLILLNEVEESPFQKSEDRQVKAFAGVLEKRGIAVTVRRRLGRDIDASCGQLRSKEGS